ncbi:MAG: glycosyltransferase family 4 protein [Pseudomonadota bacterium]
MTDLQQPAVALVFNSSWYAWNFRRSTLDAIVSQGFRAHVIAPEDEAAEKLSRLPGVDVENWRLDLYQRNPVREAASLSSLIRKLQHLRPAFVFSFTIKPNIYAGLACRFLGLRYAPNITGLGMVVGSKGVAAAPVGRLYAYAMSKAEKVFVQNSHDGDVLKRSGLPDFVELQRLPGSGVDLDRFGATPMPPREPAVFAFIGRLQKDKGLIDFIEAARQLRAEDAPARFIVVGSNEHANASTVSDRQIAAWRDEGVAVFAGAQDDVRPWLTKAHALVLPSHGGEGTPKTVLEAAASGRLSIVSNAPGCVDAVMDGETGFVHPARDVKALAEKMRLILDMPQERLSEMGKAARLLAEERFSEKIVIDAYLGCLPRRA